MRICALTLALSLIWGLALPAQTTTDQNGTVKGRITDDSGAVVPQAHLVIRGDAQQFEVVTDTRGEFTTDLPAGAYSIYTRELPMFAASKPSPLKIEPGKTKNLKIKIYLSPKNGDCLLEIK